MFGNITINTQNLYYNNTVIDDICKKIPIHVYDIYDDNIDIPIN